MYDSAGAGALTTLLSASGLGWAEQSGSPSEERGQTKKGLFITVKNKIKNGNGSGKRGVKRGAVVDKAVSSVGCNPANSHGGARVVALREVDLRGRLT